MERWSSYARSLLSPLRPFYQLGARTFFALNGKRPWTFGYYQYKWNEIAKELARADFDPERLRPGYGFRLDERIVEYPWFLSRIPDSEGALLDGGSVLNHDSIVGHRKLANKKTTILTLAPEVKCFWQHGISYVFGDLRKTNFADCSFDWVVSISTVEHVGLDNTRLYTDDPRCKETDEQGYEAVIQEFARVLKPGGALYLTVPFGEHANGGWYQIFDGVMIDNVVKLFRPGSYQQWYFAYEPTGWVASSREDCQAATYFDIHRRSDYDSDLAAASRAIACLELKKRSAD